MPATADFSLLTAAGLLYVAVVVLVIVWIILPFAVIGTKPLLRRILHEQQRTNELLNRLDIAAQQRAAHNADQAGR